MSCFYIEGDKIVEILTKMSFGTYIGIMFLLAVISHSLRFFLIIFQIVPLNSYL